MRTNDAALADRLAFLACDPQMSGALPRDSVITVKRRGDSIFVLEDGAEPKRLLCPQATLEFLHMRLFGYAIADRPQATLIHAACLRRNGRRFLLAGTKGAGKSTLTLWLMQAGFEIEGDEHVFVENGQVVARPRACRVKDESLPFLPEMAAAIEASPCYVSYDGGRIFNVDPRKLGVDWRIEQGEVSHVFALYPNHGGYSSIRPMAPSTLVRFLVPETGWRESERGWSIAALAELARGAKGYDLSLGDRATAIRCIDCALET
ncbi:MAG: hypothetical protein ACM3IH_22585 [Sphingobacteriales bacterium]